MRPVLFFRLISLEIFDGDAAEGFVTERLSAEFFGIGFDLVDLPFGEDLDDFTVSADLLPLRFAFDFGEVEVVFAKRLRDTDDALVFGFDNLCALFVGNAAEAVLLDQKSFRCNDDVLPRADNDGRLGIDVGRQLVAFVDAEVPVLVNQETFGRPENLVAVGGVDYRLIAGDAEQGAVFVTDAGVGSFDDGLVGLDLGAGGGVSHFLDAGDDLSVDICGVGVKTCAFNRSRYRLVAAACHHPDGKCQNKKLFHTKKIKGLIKK